MGVKIWLLMGGLAGLVAGLLVRFVLELPPPYLRWTQVALVLFGAIVAAAVYEGARAVTGGREPSLSTDRPRRRWVIRVPARRTRS